MAATHHRRVRFRPIRVWVEDLLDLVARRSLICRLNRPNRHGIITHTIPILFHFHCLIRIITCSLVRLLPSNRGPQQPRCHFHLPDSPWRPSLRLWETTLCPDSCLLRRLLLLQQPLLHLLTMRQIARCTTIWKRKLPAQWPTLSRVDPVLNPESKIQSVTAARVPCKFLSSFILHFSFCSFYMRGS